MRVERDGRRLRIVPSAADEWELRRRAWAETGPEAFEELLEAARERGIDVPETAYERRKRMLMRRKTEQR